MPAPTPDQQKLSKLVNKFRGISQYKSIAQVPMDEATDLINVMVSTAGYLDKFRYPLPIAAQPPGGVNVIDSMFMFTQGNGTRQLFVNTASYAGSQGGPGGLGYFVDPEDGTPLVWTQIEPIGNTYVPRFRYVSSNNLLFGVNGILVWKWTGATLLNWGLPQPAAPPMLGVSLNILSIQRTGSTITITYSPAYPGDIGPGTLVEALQYLTPGNNVQLAGLTAQDPTLNGVFEILSAPALFTVTLKSPTSGASGPYLNVGTITPYSFICGPFPIDALSVSSGLCVVTWLGTSASNNFGIYGNEQVVLANLPTPYAYLNGTYTTLAHIGDGVQFNVAGPDIPAFTPSAGTIAGGFTDIVSGRTWRFSWAISVTGEEGPASDPTGFLPDSIEFTGLVTNARGILTIPAPPAGYGIDSFFLYAIQDGGGLWVTVPGPGLNNVDECWPISGFGITVISDGFADAVLDPTISANYINFPPPQNLAYVQKWQGRIFGSPLKSQLVAYSGFDQIYRGRPESSWPPLNAIQLAIGADNVRGFGVLLNGVVIWDESNKMYMFSGTIQDITTTQPVQIADLLEEEPWQAGLSSADSIQSTPRGVVWVAADMTVQIWNGIFYGEIIGPRDLTQNFYPYMSRITPAWRPLIQSAYFNWLERDWYAILVALDGAVAPNYIFFFDLSQEGADNLGIWVMRAPTGSFDSIAVKVTSNGTRTLVASIAGVVNELHISSTAVNGIHTSPTSTTSELDAFWESGYWQDSPHQTKMFRYGRLTIDQNGFNLITTILNDETTRFRDPNPRRQILKLTPGGRFAANRKGRRQKFRIEFPKADVDASVIELYTTAIPLADI